MSYAIRLTIGVVAFVAEEEARATSARTKASVATAKTRGTRLGNPRLLLARKIHHALFRAELALAPIA